MHHYVNEYFIVESYCCVYEEPIYLISDHEKPNDDNRDLYLLPLITKK